MVEFSCKKLRFIGSKSVFEIHGSHRSVAAACSLVAVVLTFVLAFSEAFSVRNGPFTFNMKFEKKSK